MSQLQVKENDRVEKKKILEKKRDEAAAHKQKIAALKRRELPADWVNAFSRDDMTQGLHVENVGDGLLLSLKNLARVDIEYIAQVTGLECAAVIDGLSGVIYQNPETWQEHFLKGWETSDIYLFGNLQAKLLAARQAERRWPSIFEKNVQALEAVLPPAVPISDIYITLGSSWLPPEVIDDFIEHLFGKPDIYRKWNRPFDGSYKEIKTVYDNISKQWYIPLKNWRYNRYKENLALTHIYATPSYNGLYVLEKTLNNLQVKKDSVTFREKQNMLISKFNDFILLNKNLRERLTNIYNEKFCRITIPRYDGSFLPLTGLSREIELRPYQKNAVARILLSGNTLLAHETGAGKTYMMIAAGMELRRTARSKKILFLVPNNLIGQWRDTFLCMYPEAKLLCVEPKNFRTSHRQKVLTVIKDGDFDGIIMAHSCAEMIPVSTDSLKRELAEKAEEVESQASDQGGWTNELKILHTKILDELDKIEQDITKIDNHRFDKLGVTALFIDEAHNYKNIPLKTRLAYLRGVNVKGSRKCADMLARANAVRRAGGIVVLATATPISNSVSDIFMLQQYLQPGFLKYLNLNRFDAWIGNFGEIKGVFEVDVDPKFFRMVDRLARFHNLPELASIFGQVTDYNPEIAQNIPFCEGRRDVLIEKTPELEEYLKDISLRAELVRAKKIPKKEDNMLKITTDGRKAALDLRLVDRTSNPRAGKSFRCAETVYEIWRNGRHLKSTQLVFCDTSVPKAGFNLYSELKRVLVSFGVPLDEIAFVHDYDAPGQREKLYAKIRSGEIRVVIGSTFKLGLGVNIQTRLVALHHLDVPWRPSDMIQREGRILREGNLNDKVEIFRYVVEGSFDAYSWQILETKQRFITQIVNGTIRQRRGEEIDDAILSYAEVKALAVGNPLLKERFELATELDHLIHLNGRWVSDRETFRMELQSIPGHLQNAEARLKNVRLDLDRIGSGQELELSSAERRDLGEEIIKAAGEHSRSQEEKFLTYYRGFQIVLPENMLPEKQGLWLVGKGRYYVEIGESGLGCVYRLDHKISSLEKLEKEMIQQIEHLKNREIDISNILRKYCPYTKKIRILKTKLKEIDRILEL